MMFRIDKLRSVGVLHNVNRMYRHYCCYGTHVLLSLVDGDELSTRRAQLVILLDRLDICHCVHDTQL